MPILSRRAQRRADSATRAVQDGADSVGRYPGRVIIALLASSAVAWSVAYLVLTRRRRPAGAGTGSGAPDGSAPASGPDATDPAGS